MLLGHTDDHAREADQPPVVGYMKNYRMGEHNGRPCILSDLFYEKADATRLMKNFPRRSAEVFYSDKDPAENYLDGLALLVRPPARELGLVTYASGKQKERYSMADEDLDRAATAGLMIADIPQLVAWMRQQGITDTAQGVEGFLNARASGNSGAVDTPMDQKDVSGIGPILQGAQGGCKEPNGLRGGRGEIQTAQARRAGPALSPDLIKSPGRPTSCRRAVGPGWGGDLLSGTAESRRSESYPPADGVKGFAPPAECGPGRRSAPVSRSDLPHRIGATCSPISTNDDWWKSSRRAARPANQFWASGHDQKPPGPGANPRT